MGWEISWKVWNCNEGTVLKFSATGSPTYTCLDKRCERYVKSRRVINNTANMIYISFTNLSVGYINL